MLKKYLHLFGLFGFLYTAEARTEEIEYIYEKTVAQNPQISTFDQKGKVLSASIMIASNSCRAEGLSASFQVHLDNEKMQMLISPIVHGQRNPSRICLRIYDPVYTNLKLAIAQETVDNYSIMLENSGYADAIQNINDIEANIIAQPPSDIYQ